MTHAHEPLQAAASRLPARSEQGHGLLELQGVEVRAEGPLAQVLVEPVSFTLRPGEALSLLGESGSGKSLLAQAVMGSLPAGLVALGRVRVGSQVSAAGEARARKPLWGRQLALLPQEPWSALDPTMRAQAQVAETHRLVAGLPARQAWARAAEDLAGLGLAAAGAKLPSNLSGGMAQRVAFAATTAAGAPVLIADEPTKGLDTALRDQVVGLLQGVLRRGGAVLVITHDVQVARALGGRVAVMRDARVVEMGDAGTVLGSPAQPYTRGLLAADPACWPDRPSRPPSPAGAGGDLLVRAEGLTQHFGPHTVFQGLDLEIRAGERVAISGPSGSGKTSLGNALLGLARPTAGRITRGPGLGPHAFQKLYQDPLAAFSPHRPLGAALEDLLRLHRLPRRALPRLLERLGLHGELLQRLPAQVSGGELQRMALARVLLLRPALVFADEPTSRLDPLTQQQTMALLTATLEEHGGALVLVTHDPTLAGKVADRSFQVARGTEAS